MSVKRYDYGMVSDEGMWVQYPDYAALETRVKELTDERDRLEKAYGMIRDALATYADPDYYIRPGTEALRLIDRAEAVRKGE